MNSITLIEPSASPPEHIRPNDSLEQDIKLLNELELPESVGEILMKKHFLTPALCYESITEYKKYLFLGLNSKIPVTPSESVDLVWHTHLGHVEYYSKQIKTLFPHRRFDHGPTKGGQAENDKYELQYEKTL